MPPAVAVVLVVALAAVLGGALSGLLSSLSFARSEGTFRCKVRVRGARQRWYRDRRGWPRRATRARWVHDVLLVRRGFWSPRTETLPVRAPEDPVRRVPGEVPGLGPDPLRLDLRPDAGPVVEVAARAADRALLVGPFVAAGMHELPDGPVERRPQS
jgi:hypothetical protein